MARTAFAPNMVNAYVPGGSATIDPQDEALIARRESLLGPAYRLFYSEPVHIVRGEGVWLYDRSGNAYLDAYNNVASVGHCHPHVVEAVSRQAATLNTHTRYLHETIVDYAETLLRHFPDPLGRLMLTCTGSEANDLALRIARSHTGRTGIIVTALAYHGITESVAQFSPSLGEGVPLGPHVRTVRAPDLYRSGNEDVGRRLAHDVRAAIEDMRAAGIEPAAMICDTIFSSDGIFTQPAGFLAEAVETVRGAGGLFIADEVQPGFGRTGEAMWGFARHGMVPDMVTLGKPMGNGQPIAGVVARPELLERFGRTARYFNTFGGNPVSCAAAMAVLEVIERERLVDNAAKVGAYLLVNLRDVQARHEAIGDVRGAGLFVGVEFVRDRGTKVPDAQLAAHIVNGLRDRHVLISACGPMANVLKIRPPLVFSRNNVDALIGKIDEVLVAAGR